MYLPPPPQIPPKELTDARMAGRLKQFIQRNKSKKEEAVAKERQAVEQSSA